MYRRYFYKQWKTTRIPLGRDSHKNQKSRSHSTTASKSNAQRASLSFHTLEIYTGNFVNKGKALLVLENNSGDMKLIRLEITFTVDNFSRASWIQSIKPVVLYQAQQVHQATHNRNIVHYLDRLGNDEAGAILTGLRRSKLWEGAGE